MRCKALFKKAKKKCNIHRSPVNRNVARLKDALWVEPRFKLKLDENFKSVLKFGIG